MFRYGQATDNKHEKWTSISDTKKNDTSSFKHLTVYSYSEEHSEDLDYDKVKMLGDLCFDIDSKDLAESISSLQRLLNVLTSKYELDLRYIKLYCSGTKGFHVIIPQRTFDDKVGKLVKLNRLHSWMAVVLGQEAQVTFDMGLYAKRHMLRTPNKRRENEEIYKVPVAVDEAMSMTPEVYKTLVKDTRTLTTTQLIPADYLNAKLNLLWLRAKEVLQHSQNRGTKGAAVADEQLAEFGGVKGNPRCISDHLLPGELRQEATTNKVRMNLASYLGHAGSLSEAEVDKVVDDFVNDNPTNSKDSKEERRASLLQNIDYARSGGLSFRCGYMLTQLKSNPCKECPVQSSKQEEAEAQTQVSEFDDGYGIAMANGAVRKITSFKLDRSHEIFEQHNGIVHLVGERYMITTVIEGKTVSVERDIPVDAWNSQSAFKTFMKAIPSARLTVQNDNELTKLHEYIDRIQSRDKLMNTDQSGIHVIIREDKSEERVWLEGGWSLTQDGVSGNHIYTGQAKESLMTLQGVRPASPKDGEAQAALAMLMESNKPELVGKMLGWAAACHLKSHIAKAVTKQFPLLHIAGVPESGKSHSAEVYAALTGADYERTAPMVVDMLTFFPIRDAISETMTVARVFDEFNKPSMRMDHYNKVYSALKAVYNRASVAMGYMGKTNAMQKVSASVSERSATSPIIFMGKQATENEELRQRSVIVELHTSNHLLKSYRDNFIKVHASMKLRSDAGHPLQRLAKLLVIKALQLSSEDVKALYVTAEAMLPQTTDVLGSRTRVNIVTLMLGLNFLNLACTGFGEIPSRIEQLREIILKQWLRDEVGEITESGEVIGIRHENKWSTPEIMVNKFGVMATLPPLGSDNIKLQSGYHYIRDGNMLWFNPEQLLLPYTKYVRATGEHAEASSTKQIANLLRLSKAFVEEGAPGIGDAVGVWACLDLSVLKSLGVADESKFEG